ncbi:MAG: spermidine/putrescine ABC transporter permease [Phototrophicales bacterium]|nr:MAG: spermidine/putrescine ABC transporter permease [Phototrophicales bacterium]RMG70057.1 MAG: ABC transporter permease [Chloroflexota bacterium]
MATRVTSFIRKYSDVLLALPAVLWLLIFFIMPLIIVAVISMMTRDVNGIAQFPLTFDNYERVFQVYDSVLIRSVRIAFVATIICLVVGYPLAFFIKTRQNAWVRNLGLFLVILPFWTNFLVRTYAWRVLLGPEGTINTFLMNTGILNQPLEILYTETGVMLGLVYGFLPFMVLPIYASVERFDFKYVEAARDLGSNDWQTFWRVVLPLTMPGVIAGCILVFIPAIGAYVTPDLLGGTRGLMIGNLIQRQYNGNTPNLPVGAALSMVMMGAVMISLLVYARFAGRTR